MGGGRRCSATALFTRDDTAYLRPLCCFSLSALALVNLLPSAGSLMTVWVVFYRGPSLVVDGPSGGVGVGRD